MCVDEFSVHIITREQNINKDYNTCAKREEMIKKKIKKNMHMAMRQQ